MWPKRSITGVLTGSCGWGGEAVKVQYHIGLSLSIAFAVYAVYRSAAMAAASFFAGVLLDADHVFDYLREYGFRFDKEFFFHSFHHTLYRKIVLPFHAWEWLVLLAVLPVFDLGSYVSSGIFIGIGQHLIADQFTNPVCRGGYFISFRAWNRFRTSKIFPGRGLP